MVRISRNWIFITLSCLAAISLPAYSRKTRVYSPQELVQASDSIFIGKVESLSKSKIIGSSEYVGVSVLEVLKKDRKLRKVNFVIKGSVPEQNPNCCQVGKVYLFFAKNGYDVLSSEQGVFKIIRQGQKEFLSATNGKDSAYLVEDNFVLHWNHSADSLDAEKSSKKDVVSVLRQLIKEQKKPPQKHKMSQVDLID